MKRLRPANRQKLFMLPEMEKAEVILTEIQQTVEGPPTMLVYHNPNSGVFTV